MAENSPDEEVSQIRELTVCDILHCGQNKGTCCVTLWHGDDSTFPCGSPMRHKGAVLHTRHFQRHCNFKHSDSETTSETFEQSGSHALLLLLPPVVLQLIDYVENIDGANNDQGHFSA